MRFLIFIALLLASCTYYVHPDDETTASAECEHHDGLWWFETSSLTRVPPPRYVWQLVVTCRDGSKHHVKRSRP